MTEDEQDLILEELRRVFHGTLKGKLPQLKSFRLEGGALMYVTSGTSHTTSHILGLK
jgi:hypothetical protein